MRVRFLIIIFVVAGVNLFSRLNAEIFFTEKEALQFIFPEVERIEIEEYFLTMQQKKLLEKERKIKFHPEYDRNFKFYIGIFNSDTIGYAYIDTVEGKWSPITYIVRISSRGKVENLAAMNISEKAGKAVKEKMFLEQYIGKSIADTLEVHKDVDAVTGATISSRALTRGVKKVLMLFNKFYLEKKISRIPALYRPADEIRRE